MALHINGTLSQTREPPRPGTEGPQGQLISQQSHSSSFWIAPNGSVPAIAKCKKHIANILIGSKFSKKWLEISSNVAINNNLLLLWSCCIVSHVVFTPST